MMRFLFNVFQLYLIAWVTFKFLKFIVFRKFRFLKKSKKSKGKNKASLLTKIWVLISRQLHSSLDGLLTKQSVYLKAKKEQRKSLVKQDGNDAQQDSKEKVIVLKEYKRKHV